MKVLLSLTQLHATGRAKTFALVVVKLQLLELAGKFRNCRHSKHIPPVLSHKLDNLLSLPACLPSKKWLNNNPLQLNSAKAETLIVALDCAVPLIKQPLGLSVHTQLT